MHVDDFPGAIQELAFNTDALAIDALADHTDALGESRRLNTYDLGESRRLNTYDLGESRRIRIEGWSDAVHALTNVLF